MRPPKLQRRLVDREGPKRRLRDYVDITTGLPPRAADFLQCPSRQSRASLGGFRTPAPRARGIIREGPASETLHTSGLMRRSKTHRHIDSPPPLAIDSDQIFFRELARLMDAAVTWSPKLGGAPGAALGYAVRRQNLAIRAGASRLMRR
jgi:hypothetical protein